MSGSGLVLSGWLRKSPPERKLRKHAWKKRWFILRSGRLSGDSNLLEYFKHQASKKSLRSINLSQCLQIDANVPVKYERKNSNHQFVFDIVTQTRTYYLVADSSSEMTLWVRRLCGLCGFDYDHPENHEINGSLQQTFKAAEKIQIETLRAEASSVEGLGGFSPVETTIQLSDPSEPAPCQAASAGSSNFPENVISDEDKSRSLRETSPHHAEENDAEYLLLAHCQTSATSLASTLKPIEHGRRVSTDSVFTRDSDVTNHATTERSILFDHKRCMPGVKLHRLNSMPERPPPAPPESSMTSYATFHRQDTARRQPARDESKPSQVTSPIFFRTKVGGQTMFRMEVPPQPPLPPQPRDDPLYTPMMRRTSSMSRLDSVAKEDSSPIRADSRRRHSHDLWRKPPHPNRDLVSWNPHHVTRREIDRLVKPNAAPPRPPKPSTVYKQSRSHDPAMLTFRHNNAAALFSATRAQSVKEDIASNSGQFFTPSFPHHDHRFTTSCGIHDSPPRLELVEVIDVKKMQSDDEETSPTHITIVGTVPVDNLMKDGSTVDNLFAFPSVASRTSSCSSTCTGCTSDSSLSATPAGPTSPCVWGTGGGDEVSRAPRVNTSEGQQRHREWVDGADDVTVATLSNPLTASPPGFPDRSGNDSSPQRSSPVFAHDPIGDRIAPVRAEGSAPEVGATAPPAGSTADPYMFMLGGSPIVEPPPAPKTLTPAVRPQIVLEPPPVKRNLKPIRKSCGLDSDTSLPRLSESSYDGYLSDVTVSSTQSHSWVPPLSPPHTTIVQVFPAVDDVTVQKKPNRLAPPGRPPKPPSQSSLSPRTPPSVTLPLCPPDRPCTLPSSSHLPQPSLKTSPTPVPSRPPKPVRLSQGPSPPPSGRKEAIPGNNPQRPPKSTDSGAASHFFPKSSSSEKELLYADIESFPTATGGSTKRLPRAEEEVEYTEVDQQKTEALLKSRAAREKQKRCSIDAKFL